MVHTVLLFGLMKVRMAPLLTLRGTVSGLDQRLAVARMGDSFDAHLQALMQTVDALAAVGQLPAPARSALQQPLARAQASLAQWDGTLRDTAGQAATQEARTEDYRAFAQALRDMAVLEATMQKVAEAGQLVLARLTHDRLQKRQSGPVTTSASVAVRCEQELSSAGPRGLSANGSSTEPP